MNAGVRFDIKSKTSGSQTRDLVIYTLWYPFGEGESFLHNELAIVARYFDRVFVVPSHHGGSERRPTPPNAYVIEPLGHAASFGHRWLRRMRSAGVFAWTLLYSKDRWKHLKDWRGASSSAYGELGRLPRMRDFISTYGLEGAIHYDYWMFNNSVCLAALKREGFVKTLVCRAHGFDLYDERHAECVPFRDYRMAGLDAVATISEHGKRYLEQKVALTARAKIHLIPLGIPLDKTKLGPAPARGEVPLIVSCSRIHEVKRIDKMIEVLKQLKTPVRWVHIGDGPGREQLEMAAKSLPSHVSWSFLGEYSNAQVLDFYRENSISVLLNLSSSEGLPVSMMEAAAFGIPLVGPDVGGVGEVITDLSGRLVPVDGADATIAAILEEVLATAWDRRAIRELALAKFDAERAFSSFGEFLTGLAGGTVGAKESEEGEESVVTVATTLLAGSGDAAR